MLAAPGKPHTHLKFHVSPALPVQGSVRPLPPLHLPLGRPQGPLNTDNPLLCPQPYNHGILQLGGASGIFLILSHSHSIQGSHIPPAWQVPSS